MKNHSEAWVLGLEVLSPSETNKPKPCSSWWFLWGNNNCVMIIYRSFPLNGLHFPTVGLNEKNSSPKKSNFLTMPR